MKETIKARIANLFLLLLTVALCSWVIGYIVKNSCSDKDLRLKHFKELCLSYSGEYGEGSTMANCLIGEKPAEGAIDDERIQLMFDK